jgi:hypothetical protein
MYSPRTEYKDEMRETGDTDEGDDGVTRRQVGLIQGSLENK